MKCHILGSGSVGCLWACRLTDSGIRTTLLLRESTAAKISQNSVTLTVEDQHHVTSQFSLSALPPSKLDTPVDSLLVCTKSQDAVGAVQSIIPCLSTSAEILLLQNGVTTQKEIVDLVTSQTVWATASTEAVWTKTPFSICHAAEGTTWAGPLKNPRTESPMTRLLQKVSLSVVFTDAIEEKLWEKFAINCAINGLTALYRCKNGDLLRNKTLYRLKALCDEIDTILSTLALYNTENLFNTVRQVCRDTANNFSSTCLDVKNGRPTEISYLNGHLIGLAVRAGVPSPENSKLIDELRPMTAE